MVDITPTSASLIKPEWSDKVPSPAYDSMTPRQRRHTREKNPWSFLNVTLSPEDIPDDADNSPEALIALAQRALTRIINAQTFQPAPPALYLYQLRREDHHQTAIVADVALNDYRQNKIKIHEQVRHERAELLAKHVSTLGVVSSPIAMTYRNNDAITTLIEKEQRVSPHLRIDPVFGVEQTIWRIDNPDSIQSLCDAFMDQLLYIIDGHHRAAAALAANTKNSKHADQLFTAIFPHDQLRLVGFNRWIRVDSEHSVKIQDQLCNEHNAKILQHYTTPHSGQLIIYANGQWLSMDLQESALTDAGKLQEQLLEPVFSITQPDDSRIENVPGNQPFQKLCRKVDQYGGIAIFLAPLSIDNFLSIADSNILLPPKSTYFTPKIQSGVFLRSIE